MITHIQRKKIAGNTDTALRPQVTILLPFEPKVAVRADLDRMIARVMQRVETELEANYPVESKHSLMQRLKKVIGNLNYSTLKKSVAIFVSLGYEKVYYLDIDLNERIVLGEPFCMRDLICNKRDKYQFLLLVATAQNFRIFVGKPGKLTRILSSLPDHMQAFKFDTPEKEADLSDPADRDEILLDKFLHYADHTVGLILASYPLPVFLMATEHVAKHFRQITSHGNQLVGHVYGDFEDAAEPALQRALNHSMDEWEKVKEQHLMNRLGEAMHAGKLASGLRAVCKDALMNKGQLLVIERNYAPHVKGLPTDNFERHFYIRDAIDRAIENVLKSGGEVEFVNDQVLKEYRHIALVKYTAW